MSFKTIFTVIAASAAALAGPAFGDSGASLDGKSGYGVKLEGVVPVICRVSVDRQAPEGGSADLGAMTEFCNSPGGYQVWVDHAALEGAALTVDGERVDLSAAGSTLISASATAAFRIRKLSLEAKDGQLAALSLRIVPL